MATDLKFRLYCLLLDEVPLLSLSDSVHAINVESHWSHDEVKQAIQGVSPFYKKENAGYIKLYILKEYLDDPILSTLSPNPQDATSYGEKAVTKFTGVAKISRYFHETLSSEDTEKIHLIATVHSQYPIQIKDIGIADLIHRDADSQFLS